MQFPVFGSYSNTSYVVHAFQKTKSNKLVAQLDIQSSMTGFSIDPLSAVLTK